MTIIITIIHHMFKKIICRHFFIFIASDICLYNISFIKITQLF